MTSISKNVYIDKVDDIVNKYNNTCSTIKMKHVAVKSNTYIDSSKQFNVEHQNIEMFLQKVTLQIGLKRFFWLKG